MSRPINRAGLELIKRHEGFSAEAYLCPAGRWTVGYGHTRTAREGMVVTEEQAEELLRQDLEEAQDAVWRLVTVPLNDNQYAALVSFVFNVGSSGLRHSTLRKRLNAGDYAAVPRELKRWNKARVNWQGRLRVLPGLVARRRDEAELWEKPVEPEAPVTDAPQDAAPSEEAP